MAGRPLRGRSGGSSVPAERANPQDVPTSRQPDAPPRREGRQAGYPHRDDWHQANKALAKALSRLARDRDPLARLAGADIAAAVAELVAQAAALAGDSSSASQRAAAQVHEQLPRLARQLDDLRATLGRRGVVLTGPQQPGKGAGTPPGTVTTP